MNDIVGRLRAAHENSAQRIVGSDIFKDAADEIENLLGILGTIRRECGTPWRAPEDARTTIMRMIPNEAP